LSPYSQFEACEAENSAHFAEVGAGPATAVAHLAEIRQKSEAKLVSVLETKHDKIQTLYHSIIFH